jgi:hypothetical protein
VQPNVASIQSLNGQLSCDYARFSEKRLRFLQILGVEAFGEPAVNRGEQLIRVLAFASALP